MDLNHVDTAIVENYRKLRTRIGIIAFMFPLVLIAAGWGWGIGVQPTLSNYYFAQDPLGRVDLYPVRLWFCGFLFVVGVFLYKYQGFSKNEDRWLSAAGLFALLVAVFPMSVNGKNEYDFVLAWIGLSQLLSLHGIFAFAAFGCIAVVIFWYADSTLLELRATEPVVYERYKTIYSIIAAYMILSIVTSIALNYLHHGQGFYVLVAEASGLWAFAAYWFVKNSELTKVGRALEARHAPMPHRAVADFADKL
jgi:hypothetical protein